MFRPSLAHLHLNSVVLAVEAAAMMAHQKNTDGARRLGRAAPADVVAPTRA